MYTIIQYTLHKLSNHGPVHIMHVHRVSQFLYLRYMVESRVTENQKRQESYELSLNVKSS